MNPTHFIWFLCFTSLFGCATKGMLQVESIPSQERSKDPIEKILLIDPDVVSLENVKDREDMILKTEVRQQEFMTLLEENAEKAKIDLEIVSQENLTPTQVSYFNDLQPLKETIWQANFLQEANTKRKIGSYFSSYSKRTFTKQIVLDSEHSWLAEEYGTPYFLLSGIIYDKEWRLFRSNWNNFLFCILVDVERGEVIYREIRKFELAPNRTHLNSVLFDAFHLMQKAS